MRSIHSWQLATSSPATLRPTRQRARAMPRSSAGVPADPSAHLEIRIPATACREKAHPDSAHIHKSQLPLRVRRVSWASQARLSAHPIPLSLRLPMRASGLIAPRPAQAFQSLFSQRAITPMAWPLLPTVRITQHSSPPTMAGRLPRSPQHRGMVPAHPPQREPVSTLPRAVAATA